MSVTLRQMRLFVAVAHEMSFTAAAGTVNITQSALTAAIRSLESQLGLRLLDRTTRRVRLTAEGEQFLAVAERLLSDIDASLENIRSIAARTRGHVTLSSASSFLRYVACPAVARLARTHPGVSVRLVEQTVDIASRAVLAGEVDFAICGLVQPNVEISNVTILRDRFGVLGLPTQMPGQSNDSRKHDAGRSEPVRWSELDPDRYVALASSYGLRQLIERHRSVTDALRSPRYEVASTASLALLLEEGLGYGIVPAMTAQPLLTHDFVFRLLEGPVLHRELHIIKRRNHGLSPAAIALVEQFTPIIAALETIDGIEVLLNERAVSRFLHG
ncbi:MAG TPA: LysR family transcriptional regulator [Burkholderiaceae bacterium]|nr:LysR family transcriptional regulator [Burkholderiaceae bacterium]